MAKGGLVTTTQVASSVPFDNTVTGATGFSSTNVEDALIEVYKKVAGATGNVTPPFIFSYPGSLGSNSYMQVGGVNSNQAGQIIQGTNNIIGLTITTSQVYNAAQTIQIQIRSGVSTRTDVTGAAVTILGDNAHYSATIVFATPIALTANAEISAYLKSGNGISNAVLAVYVVPQ